MALQVWLPLNGSLENKGCSNVQFTQNSLTYTTGKIGQCAYFSSGIKTNTVTIPALSGAKKFSIATWIKVPSNQTITNWADVITLGCSSGSSTTTFRLEQTTNNTSLCWFGNGVLTNDGGVGYYPSNVRDDTWHHLVVASDNQKIYRYWDGALFGELTIADTYKNSYLTGTMSIGDTGNYCYLNDVRVYDHCLSAAEVKEISRGLVLHYKLDDPYIEPTINIAVKNGIDGWNNSGTCIYNSNDTTIGGVFNNCPIYSVTKDTEGDTAARFTIISAENLRGKTVTASTYIWLSSNCCPAVPYLRSTLHHNGANSGSDSIAQLTYKGSGNISTWPKEQWIYISGTGTVAEDETSIYICDYLRNLNEKRYYTGWQIEEKDHATPYVNGTRSASLVSDSSGYGNNGTIDNGNLVTGINRGGQTTVENGVVTTSGVNADTYFNLLMSESLTQGVTYTISCIAENMPQNTNWRFPIGGQSNTSLIFEINKNGLNYYTFTMNDFDAGTNQCFMDDVSRTAYQNQCKFYNWRIERADKQILSTESISPRYDHCFKWNGACDIRVKNPLYVTTTTEIPALTVALWYKPSSSNSAYHTLTSNAYPHSGFWISTNCEGYPLWMYRGSLYIRGTGVTISNNTWNHIVLTWNGTNYQFYLNGNPVTMNIGNSNNYTYIGPYFQEYLSIGGNRNTNTAGSSGDYRDYGSTSDYRLYATALSAEDVKQLYEVSGKVDNLGGIHSYEFTEESGTSTKILKTGIAKAQLVSELLTNQYDNNFYIEPDGSVWVRIVHHNNPASYKFNSTDPFTTKVYIDENRWFKASLCNKISGSWELMCKQKATSDAAETKYRWVQSYNPMTATFDQTTASNVTVNTSTGYTSGQGGLYYNNGTNSYLVRNNGTNGNWWGSVGCWTNWNGGIPGFGGATVTTGYVDLYLRVDNANIDVANFAINSMNGTQLIEM